MTNKNDQQYIQNYKHSFDMKQNTNINITENIIETK